jgi:putative hydrolase of HD superfamily
MTAAQSPEGAAALADAVIELGALALAFARIDRTACYHPDQVTPESDTDHTVMLAWVAPSLAALLYPGELDTGLAAQFAVVHDAMEVFAGDTPTLRIDAVGNAAKAHRERVAAQRWSDLFAARLPWLPQMTGRCERQEEAEARFVRAVDKDLPKLVHFQDAAAGLAREGIPAAELAGIYQQQPSDISQYAGEFTALTQLRHELAARVVAVVTGRTTAPAPDLGEPLQPNGERISPEEAQAG